MHNLFFFEPTLHIQQFSVSPCTSFYFGHTVYGQSNLIFFVIILSISYSSTLKAHNGADALTNIIFVLYKNIDLAFYSNVIFKKVILTLSFIIYSSFVHWPFFNYLEQEPVGHLRPSYIIIFKILRTDCVFLRIMENPNWQVLDTWNKNEKIVCFR